MYPAARLHREENEWSERLLEARLASLGVAVERQTTLQGFVDHGNGITATLQHADGGTERVQCAYLCGCDGARSAVRHGLGMDFAGDAMPGSWLLADVHLAGDVALRELSLGFADDGVFALFPIPGDRFRVLASVADSDVGAPPTLADVRHRAHASASGRPDGVGYIIAAARRFVFDGMAATYGN